MAKVSNEKRSTWTQQIGKYIPAAAVGKVTGCLVDWWIPIAYCDQQQHSLNPANHKRYIYNNRH